MSQCIFPSTSLIRQTLEDAVHDLRIILVAGLPSSGKSLVFQQLTILASEAGRRVHTLQWDDARHPFETDAWLSVYPDPLPGTTHPAIRKAIGLWVRKGVTRWAASHDDAANILIVEVPIVGGRFIELMRPSEDDAEGLLSSDKTKVIVTIPTDEVREKLEGFRAASHANPRNDGEAMEAAPSVVKADWIESRQLYNSWEGIPDDPERDSKYDRDIAHAVFLRLTRHRKTHFLDIDQVFDTKGSTFDRPVPVTGFRPTETEVTNAYARLKELFTGNNIESATNDWADY